MSSPFDPRSHADVLALVRAYPLAWVIGHGGAMEPLDATPLPLLPELDDGGRIVSFLGHFARANPQVDALRADPRALLLFNGPDGYIPPRLVSNPRWGPTWNYAVARFAVRIEFVPDENAHALKTLAATLEAGNPEPWTPERMGPDYPRKRQHIIAFHAHVEQARATFKLGQDEQPRTFHEIVAGMDDPALRAWMVAQRD
ncbi:FMN-binding negative transcriptional regulator [Luteimonas sp. 100069]|uniref:FMN-binding negative transcriptional regulator n=1 Tax=Luteimonas sp. 100069 TaxID=2006109 RepID=UPI0013156ECA|nr:FMN-binding negative transcriptional regulator [Luteimonas sp. 100069]